MTRATGREATAACPGCGAESGHRRPKFTWWGGLLGPKLLHHTVCGACGTGFNGRTGNPNKGAITLYMVVGVVVSVLAGLMILFM